MLQLCYFHFIQPLQFFLSWFSSVLDKEPSGLKVLANENKLFNKISL